MATNNINKIVRGNLNLKPWILSKNPTDIVNGYVQKLYEQMPNNFKNDLLKPRLYGPGAEDRFRHRPVKISMERLPIPIVNKPKPKLQTNSYRSPPITIRNNFLPASKKFLKSPNYKIYNTRQYGSSASSSNASFNRTGYEEHRKKIYKPAIGMQYRTFTGSASITNTPHHNNPDVINYTGPLRLYNDVQNQLNSLEITNTICKDLMFVDELLKKKIRVAKGKTFAEPSSMPKQDINGSSFKGWNHPSALRLHKLTAAPFLKKPLTTTNENDRNLPGFSLMNTRRRQAVKATKPPGPSPRWQTARHQVPLMPHYTAPTNYKPYGNPKKNPPEKEMPPPKKAVENEVYDFICRSRTALTTRRSVPRPVRGSVQSFRKM